MPFGSGSSGLWVELENSDLTMLDLCGIMLRDVIRTSAFSTYPWKGGNAVEEKVYQAPEIIFEGELEVQAGSPLGAPDPLDPFFEG